MVGFYNVPVIWGGKQESEKPKQNSHFDESEDMCALPCQSVLCLFPTSWSPVSDLHHEGRFHVYPAAVSDGAVGERAVMPISCLEFYGVDHCLMREKQAWGSLLTSSYGDQHGK